MKKALLIGAALSVALSASAFAADLPSRKAAPPAYAPPPPLATWGGFYVGLNAGYAFGASNNVLLGPGGNVPAFQALQLTGAVPYNVSVNNDGFIGGGQIGYNWQYGNIVAGIEADIQGIAGSSGSANTVGAFGPFLFGTQTNRSLDYLGTVRGRIGYAITPTLLLYGTGGLAYGGTNVGFTLAGPAPFNTASTFSDTRVGWTAGGGVEWMFIPNWSAKVEYLYYNLGSVAAPAAFVTGGGNFASITPQTKFDGHVVRAGVNYHFNWGSAPTLAKF